jgi:hypothetical protein
MKVAARIAAKMVENTNISTQDKGYTVVSKKK